MIPSFIKVSKVQNILIFSSNHEYFQLQLQLYHIEIFCRKLVTRDKGFMLKIEFLQMRTVCPRRTWPPHQEERKKWTCCSITSYFPVVILKSLHTIRPRLDWEQLSQINSNHLFLTVAQSIIRFDLHWRQLVAQLLFFFFWNRTVQIEQSWRRQIWPGQ